MADAISYLQTSYKIESLIELSTLTGAIVVALGQARAGLFCNDKKLAKALIKSGEKTGELLWQMPFDDNAIYKRI